MIKHCNFQEKPQATIKIEIISEEHFHFVLEGIEKTIADDFVEKFSVEIKKFFTNL